MKFWNLEVDKAVQRNEARLAVTLLLQEPQGVLSVREGFHDDGVEHWARVADRQIVLSADMPEVAEPAVDALELSLPLGMQQDVSYEVRLVAGLLQLLHSRLRQAQLGFKALQGCNKR